MTPSGLSTAALCKEANLRHLGTACCRQNEVRWHWAVLLWVLVAVPRTELYDPWTQIPCSQLLAENALLHTPTQVFNKEVDAPVIWQ